MKNIVKFGLLILILSLALPLVSMADDDSGGPSYLDWLRQQQAKGNPAGAQQAATASTDQQTQTTPLAATTGPIGYQVDYTGQTDVTGFMQRLTNLLTSPDWFGSNQTLAPMIKGLKDSGKLNLTGCKETLHIDQNAVHYTLATHYMGLAPDSLKGRLYALPNRPLASAQYVGNDALLYFGINNVPQTALEAFHWLVAHPEQLQKGPLADLLNKALSDQLGGQSITPDQLQQASGLLDSSGVANQLNALLTGEIGAALFDADVKKLSGKDFQPEDLDLAVFVGVKDSAGVEKLLTTMGGDAGVTAAGEAGGWKLFKIKDKPSLGLALNGNILLGATRFDAFIKRLQSDTPKVTTPDCQYYVRFNLQRLIREYGEPLGKQALSEGLDPSEIKGELDKQGLPSIDKLDAAWGYLLEADKLGDLGALTLSGRYDKGYQCDVLLKPDVFIYGLYELGRVGGLAAIQEQLKQESQKAADQQPGAADDVHPDMAEPSETIVPGAQDELKNKPAEK